MDTKKTNKQTNQRMEKTKKRIKIQIKKERARRSMHTLKIKYWFKVFMRCCMPFQWFASYFMMKINIMTTTMRFMPPSTFYLWLLISCLDRNFFRSWFPISVHFVWMKLFIFLVRHPQSLPTDTDTITFDYQ